MVRHNILWTAGALLGMYAAPAQAEINHDIDLPLPSQLEQTVPPAVLAQQPDPNQDRFLQPGTDIAPPEVSEEQPILPESPDEVVPDPLPSPPDTVSPLIPVGSVEVLGTTVFGPADLNPIIQPLQGQSVTLEALQATADAITQLYLDQGYLTSRAILVDQVIADGVVRIQVIEGQLAEIQVQGNQRLSDRYIQRRIRLGADSPLRSNRLEDQLRLLRADPLIENIEASLRAGDEIGQSVLLVRVTEASPWILNLSTDNYSPPSVGSERIGAEFGYRNLTGLGDQLLLGYDRTTRNGANVFEFSYRVPLNLMEGTLQLRTVIDRNEVVQEPFDRLNIEGASETYEVSFRQPLVRSPREEFALSLGFTHKDGQTFLFDRVPTPFGFGPDADGVSRTSVLRFGQDYVRRDVQGAWALRSQFSLGLDLFNATINDEPIPDGRFLSWLGQVQRFQRLDNNQFLVLQADLQLTPDSLLPSEQFVLGGGQSLRGYRQNARSGDNGLRLSLEDRFTVQRDAAGAAVFQLAPFAEIGAVWNNSGNPNTLPDQTFLASLGVGALWEPVPNVNIRLDAALPLVDLDDRGENAQDLGFYFSVIYRLF